MWEFAIPIKLEPKDVEIELETKLLNIVEFGLLPLNSWTIKFRSDRTWCRIIFPNLSKRQIAMIKLILDDTEWFDGESLCIYWNKAKPVKEVKKIASRPIHSAPTPRQITPSND